MTLPRFYIEAWPTRAVAIGAPLALPPEVAHHVAVRRLRAGDRLRLFDGSGREWEGRLEGDGRRHPYACVVEAEVVPLPEPRQPRVLATALLSAERLDWVVQKGVELGMTHWVPLLTAFSQVALSADRAEKKVHHWQRVAQAAAAQCGRATVPEILLPVPLSALGAVVARGIGPLGSLNWYWLQPGAPALAGQAPPTTGALFLVGPEGGWHPEEVAYFAQRGATAVGLAPWVLRAETAAVVVLAQSLWWE